MLRYHNGIYCVDFHMSNWIEVLILATCLSPIWGTFLWCFWECFVQPGLIPRDRINAEVEKLYARHGDDAFEHACMNEHRAWYDSDGFEQGRWRRIRREIMQRERALGATFRKLR